MAQKSRRPHKHRDFKSVLAKLKNKSIKRVGFSGAQLGVFGLVFAAIGGYILYHSFASTPSAGANVFVSANGSDSGSNCIRFAAPVSDPDASGASLCASFNKAYQLASPGDRVEVEGGSYASQSIPYTSAKPNSYHCDWAANNDIYNPTADYSGCITFAPASGATVNLGGLRSEAPYLKLDGGATQAFRFDRTNSLATQAFDYCEITSTINPITKSLTGNITNGSPVISGLASTNGLVVGHVVVATSGSGTQLPTGTKIVSVDSPSQVTLSNNATITQSGASFKFDTGQLLLGANTTSGSPVVSGLSDTSGLAKNLVVSGNGIPNGTTIASIDSASQITLSQAAMATGSPTLTFNIGCYYGSDGITLGGGPQTTAYTCYGLTGKPQEQSHDDVIMNVWSNDIFVLSGAHNAIINSTFDVGDSWRPDGGSSHMEGCHDSTLTPAATAPGDYLELQGVTIKNVLLTHASNACVSGSTCPSGWMSYHVAPLHWEGGTNSRVESSWFENNGGHNIELEPEDGYTTADNLLVENSVFGALCAEQQAPPSGYCGSQGGAQVTYCQVAGYTVSNIVWRFNTDVGSGYNEFSKGSSSCNWGGQLLDYANVNTDAAPDASSFACTSQLSTPGVSWSYNLWASGGASPCGSNTIIGDPALVSSNLPMDPHLQATSAAIDRVPPGSGFTACPATDYYGTARPQGSACDVGADEYTGPTAIDGDVNNDGHVNISDLSIILANWGSTANAACDLNHNGVVDISDLSILLSNYGK